MIDQKHFDIPNREELAQLNLQKIQKQMEKFKVDAVILNRSDNVRFVTGIMPTDNIIFTHRQAVLLIKGQSPILFACAHYTDYMKKDFWIKDVRPFPRVYQAWAKQFHQALEEFGVEKGVIALDPYMFFSASNLIRDKLKDATIIDAGDLLFECRMIKNEEEIRTIDAACAIGEAALEDVMNYTKPGITEIELSARLSYKCLLQGAEGLYARRGSLACSGDRLAHHLNRQAGTEFAGESLSFWMLAQCIRVTILILQEQF